jgi:hypothetical protein
MIELFIEELQERELYATGMCISGLGMATH